MTQLSNPEIAQVLAHDGFPPELLDDEDMPAEIAHGLRADAAVADRLAERISPTGRLTDPHVLCGRAERFIPTERRAARAHRASGEFQPTVVPGRHSLDATRTAAVGRAPAGALAATRTEEDAA
ncbi:hypothetical protein ACIBBD_18060 [Streptomyces sp. NPDC051315]|uniref:hypothetical protein n=1 Tax=Streptomyces sp. NPDC051315 TaxID=3365650 RepID=UPI0037B1DF58